LQANYSFFWGEQIVPDWMRAWPPEEQAYQSTPETYRWLSRQASSVKRIAPLQIDYAIRNLFDRMVTDVLRAVERGRLPESAREVPGIGRMILREPRGWGAASVQRVAELEEKYQELKDRWEALPAGERARINQQIREIEWAHEAYRDVRRIADEIRQVRNQPTPDKERIKRLERDMRRRARAWVERFKEAA